MLIDFACSCGCKLQAKEQHAGARVTCPECGRKMTVPSLTSDKPSRRPAEDEDDFEDDRPRRSSRERDPEMSTKAALALISGLASFFLTVLTAIPALILALMSFGDIGRSRGRLTGKGLALTGLILACVGSVVGGVGGYFAYRHFYPSEDKDKEAKDDDSSGDGGNRFMEAANRKKVENDFHQITLAIQMDADANVGQMMAPAIYSKDGKPLLSWRVALLPYMEEIDLYHQFHLDEAWDSPHNIQLLSRMPKVYAHPNDPDGAKRGQTCFRVFTGPETAFPQTQPPAGWTLPTYERGMVRYPASFTDGTSQSILVVEAAESVPWTKPDELPFDLRRPLPKLGGHFQKGFLAGMADGSVRALSPKVSEQTLRAAITIAGNDLLGPDW